MHIEELSVHTILGGVNEEEFQLNSDMGHRFIDEPVLNVM